MIRHTAARTWSFWKHRSGWGCRFLLLAVVLMACGSGSLGAAGLFPRGNCTSGMCQCKHAAGKREFFRPDGNVWFPAIATNISRPISRAARSTLQPNGQFHLFPLPAANSYPTAMTFASDGSFWFIAFQGNGELTPNVDSAPALQKMGQKAPDLQSGDEWPPAGVLAWEVCLVVD